MLKIKRLLSLKTKLTLLKILPLFGIYNKNQAEDRILLEKTIIPYFINKENYHRIIFIGVAWYTMEYNKFFKKKEFWTIDCDPKMKIYGAKRHIVDSMENMDKYFAANSVDLIICNGVFGWGLNDPRGVEKAFKICFDLIRESGIFIIGWNDVPDHRPIPLEDCKALSLFNPLVFEPLGVQTILCTSPNRHTYSFYIKNKDKNS